MSKIRARAQAQFPSVLLTLISIIQALALELMWSKIMESDFLWSWSMQSVLAWGMLSVAFLGMLQIWIMYATMVMGFTWRPLLRDSILPFVIGIQEFMMISMIGEEFNTLWLYVLASIFVTANWVSHSSLRRARLETENAQFFSTVEPATFKDFIPAITIIMVLVLLGIAADLTANTSWIPLSALVFANIMLAVQLIGLRKIWHTLMALPELS